MLPTKFKVSAFLPAIAFLLIFFFSDAQIIHSQSQTNPTSPIREFRAAWVATVANINWPSKPGLSTETQKQEAIYLLDFLKEHHFNAVIFQARPQSDALYDSKLEPWSYYLTGTQGKPPAPYYDPLDFWVTEAHARGLELHVWLNPYRAHHKDGGPISEKSIVKTKPALAKYLKEGYWWLDPAAKGTQDHSYDVAMDIVNRYDIDGLHFDDYFYPYPSYNLGEDFPDQDSWNAYQKTGGKLTRGDWRREAVNNFIERLYTGIKASKPHVKFGLSPFGIWRPGYPAQIEGFDQYDQLYADARLWLQKGWVDYFAPQLYWPIQKIPQSYPVLLGWWQQQNTQNRHLWPGISVGRDTSAANTREIINQVLVARGMVPNSMGVVHWSIGQLTRNPTLSTALAEGVYKQTALVPASPWLGKKIPPVPKAKAHKKEGQIEINLTSSKEAFQWIVYTRYGKNWSSAIYPVVTKQAMVSLKKQTGKENYDLQEIRLSSISRTGMESESETISW